VTKVAGNVHKPVLLLDVDGVFSLFAPGLDTRSGGRWLLVEGMAHFLSDSAGELLRSLCAGDAFECVWCTGWEERADEHLRRHYGLERAFDHLVFDHPPSGAHWKLAAIDERFGPHRALAWIDDMLDERVERWAEERPGPTLLVPTDPGVGLTEEHAATVQKWAEDPLNAG
jgi:hypothetical protein